MAPLKARAGPRLQRTVLAFGWLTVFILIGSFVLAPAVASALFILRLGANAPVTAPSADFLSEDLLLIGTVVLLAAIVYGAIRGLSLLSVGTFGEALTEEAREETSETIDQASETADTAAETIDQHTD
jgi:hypothetical protein